MQCSVIALSSVTAAKRVERASLEKGIKCQTLHTPKIITKNGCSHSVRIAQNALFDVLNICRQLGVQIRGVYNEISVGKGKIKYEKVEL